MLQKRSIKTQVALFIGRHYSQVGNDLPTFTEIYICFLFFSVSIYCYAKKKKKSTLPLHKVKNGDFKSFVRVGSTGNYKRSDHDTYHLRLNKKLPLLFSFYLFFFLSLFHTLFSHSFSSPFLFFFFYCG